MTLPFKAGIATINIGSIAGIGYVGNAYFNKSDNVSIQNAKRSSINELIKEKFEYILLDTTAGTANKDKSIWETNWGNYKTASQALNQDIFHLEGWTKTDTKDLTEKLKEKCKELSKKDDESLYESVTKYCGREATIEDEAGKEGLIILKTEDNTEDNTNWKSKIDAKQQLQQSLNKLNITDSSLTADKLKNSCKTTKIKKRKDTGYGEFYNAYKAVCTNPKQQ